jgi:hypothetical protein
LVPRIPAATRAAAGRVAALPGVQGVFVDGGKRPVLTAHVASKHPEDALPPEHLISRIAGPVATQVVAVGRPRAHALDQSDLVVVPGDGPPRRGTLTVVARTSGAALGLLSGHVCLPYRNGQIARSYAGGASVGFAAVQSDGTRYEATLIKGKIGGAIDWAVARFDHTPPSDTDPGHTAAFDDAPLGIRRRKLEAGEPVRQASAMRNKRIPGTVRGFSSAPVKLRVEDEVIEYDEVVVVESGEAPFSVPGDSGSLVVDESKLAWGAIVGASDDGKLAYVLTLPPLLAELGNYAGKFFAV